jgi:hypothetical protein
MYSISDKEFKKNSENFDKKKTAQYENANSFVIATLKTHAS